MRGNLSFACSRCRNDRWPSSTRFLAQPSTSASLTMLFYEEIFAMPFKRSMLAMVLGGLSTAAMPAEVGQSRFDGIIYNEKVSDLGTVGFRSLPTQQDIARAFSPKSQSAYRVAWDCSISGTGQLKNCKLNAVWPATVDLSLVSGILEKVRLDRQTVNNARQHHARLALTVYLDDGRQELNRSCPPGWCPTTLAPPADTSRPLPSR